MSVQTNESDTVGLAVEITIAWLANPSTRASVEDVASFLGAMHSAVSGLTAHAAAPEAASAPASEEVVPATTVRRSLASKDHIISMIDGKPYRTLRRHLNRHGLTPETYRERFGLRPDYPMVAPSYSEARREMAKRIGLGRAKR